MLESRFNEVAGWRPATLLKSDFNTSVFLWNFQIFKNIYFEEHLQTTASALQEFLRSDSHLPKNDCVIFFIESPLRMARNAFYFILKRLFGHVEKTGWLELYG